MYSQILDQETYQAVVLAAPRSVQGDYEEVARGLIGRLVASQTANPSFISEDQSVWHLPILDAAEGITSPNIAGRVFGQLGLLKQRRRDGYHVFWTQHQLDILVQALGVKDVH